MIPISVGITPLIGFFKDTWKYYEYWKDYKDKQIQIRSETVSQNNQHQGFQMTNFIIEGTVKDVMSYPPGFLLSDVTEYITFQNQTGVLEDQEQEDYIDIGLTRPKPILVEIVC